MRKTINRLQADPSKVEEIQFLETIAESIPDDAYLKRLFTERFVNFIAQKIRDDWYCDFMDMYQAEINNVTDARAELGTLQRDFEKYVSARNQEIEGLNVTVEKLEGELDLAKKQAEQEYDRYWKLRQQLGEVNRKAMRDVDLLEKENEDLKEEVVKLKAKMFDMQEEINLLMEVAPDNAFHAD